MPHLRERMRHAALALDSLFVRPDGELGQNLGGETYRMRQRLKDFVQGSLKLFWQRQVMFLGVAIITVSYYNPFLAMVCYLICLSSEMLDLYYTKRILHCLLYTSDAADE